MTIFGADLSHYDAPDARSMLADGISFMTHKAGGDSNDDEFGPWWRYVKGYRSQGVLLGAYWVLYPGNPSYRADQFIQRLDAVCDGWRDGPFLLQVDAELWNNNTATRPSIGEINIFCDRLTGAMPKLNPVVYAPKWVYGDQVSALRYPTWASSYVTGSGHYRDLYPGDGTKQWGAYGGRGPSILQYSSSATIGGQSTCDVNAFRGTMQQLINLVAPGWKARNVAQLDRDDYTNIAAAIANYDINPDPNVQSTWAGSAWTTLQRAGILNTLPGLIQTADANTAEEIAQQVITLLDPGTLAAKIAAALPADGAKQVADQILSEIAGRLEN